MNAIWITGAVFLFFIALESGISYWINLGKGRYIDGEQHE